MAAFCTDAVADADLFYLIKVKSSHLCGQNVLFTVLTYTAQCARIVY